MHQPGNPLIAQSARTAAYPWVIYRTSPRSVELWALYPVPPMVRCEGQFSSLARALASIPKEER